MFKFNILYDDYVALMIIDILGKIPEYHIDIVIIYYDEFENKNTVEYSFANFADFVRFVIDNVIFLD